MAEGSDRLHLIQRAARHLGNMTETSFAGLRPTPEPGPLSDLSGLPKSQEPVLPAFEYGTTPPARPTSFQQDSEAPSARTSRSLGLNFSELRRMGMITPDNMSSSVSFEFRAIKRKLLARVKDAKTQAMINNLVMITSALPSEGKTFTATNLALTLAAERDLHVLLIDGDLIHPSLGSMFEPTDGKGLIDLLNGNCTNISEIMHRCRDLPNMSVIFAGKRDERTPELVSSRKMADLCHDISTRYNDRIIIIDTSPVLASAEPANVAMHVHQIVMVVAAGQTSRSQLQAALENVSACRNISVVFNKAPKWHQVDGDTYYYAYGKERAGNT